MTTTSSPQSAIVYIYLPVTGYVPAGRLKYDAPREMCSFRYGEKYLQRKNALPVDPVTLPLSMKTERSTRPGEKLFTALRDAAPDHWGRKVLSVMAGRHVDTLSEFELLTAGFTENRIGALAFGSTPSSGPHSFAEWFDPKGFSRITADLNQIAELVRLVDEAGDDEIEKLRETLPYDAFLQALAMSPSVGGARPKCLFNQNGLEFIVKFPKSEDAWNEPRIEHATMTLAAKCGINVADTHINRLKNGDCLFVRRFDRSSEGSPRHFVSGYAMGDLQEDGDWKSYQHLAQEARRYGNPSAGEELFRRMVFNICCKNIDDHPRNQAFFVHRNRVELTPAYDLVPTSWDFSEYSLAMGCGHQGRIATIENALSDIAPFGITQGKATEIIDEMTATGREWESHFANHGVSEKDLELVRKRLAF